MKKAFLFVTYLLLVVFTTQAQDYAIIFGKATDTENAPLELVNIGILGKNIGTASDENGNFELRIPSNTQVTIIFSYLGYKQEKFLLNLEAGMRKKVSVKMQLKSQSIKVFEISEEQTRTTTMEKLNPRVVTKVPTPTGSFESILFSKPSVISNNELSSQYSVRGGNFDENLVYVNDIEIYRPFLVRSGQQEGLSFINSDLVEDALFSAGGFEAKYGDKMSSVLDITYREPKEFEGSVTASMLGANVHVGDASDNYRFTQMHGLRYKTNQYVLNSLNTQGAYRPLFIDYQGFFTYDLSDEWEVNVLANYSKNRYNFIPETRETDFGTINSALRLTVFFEGQELNEFETYNGAVSFNYKPTKNMTLKFITSIFRTQEEEKFDVLGEYFLDELEKDLSKENFGDVAFNRGVGGFLNHARNYLDATVINLYHKGEKREGNNTYLWGVRLQKEFIADEIREWELLDSSGYSLPQAPNDEIVLNEFVNTQNTINSNRVMGYFQQNISWLASDTSEFTFTAGVRFNYWDFSNQVLFSPRATLAWEPNWERDFLFRASAGVYRQPPFYRELRNLDGNINRDIEAQTSIHFVLGSDFNFTAWSRPFKLTTETYFKYLDNLIPYEIDNVRIRYYGTNNSKGYAAGFETQINGEIVKGVDSWVSLGILTVKENIEGDDHFEYYNAGGELITFGVQDNEVADSALVDGGYIPRPTDQRVNFGLFFQDYLPKNPTYKVHLNLLFSTGFPFGAPGTPKYTHTLRSPFYRRVDIGFSKQIIGDNRKKKERKSLKFIKSMWLSAEVFNLLQVPNTISYIWVKDITNTQFAVPNYLTARRLNVKLAVKF